MTSGASVQRPSMLHDASSTKRAGSLQVQPLTSRPASWQRAMTSAVIVGSHGWTAVCPRRTRSAGVSAPTSSVSQAVGTSGATRWQRSTVSRRKLDSSQRPGARSARWASTSTATRSPGSKSGSYGAFLISMLTHAPAHASSASPSVGTCSGRSRHGVSTITRPSGSTASWCTTTTPSTVRRASSSMPWAPSATAARNAVRRVLVCQARCAPVGDDLRHGGTVPLVMPGIVA